MRYGKCENFLTHFIPFHAQVEIIIKNIAVFCYVVLTHFDCVVSPAKMFTFCLRLSLPSTKMLLFFNTYTVNISSGDVCKLGRWAEQSNGTNKMQTWIVKLFYFSRLFTFPSCTPVSRAISLHCVWGRINFLIMFFLINSFSLFFSASLFMFTKNRIHSAKNWKVFLSVFCFLTRVKFGDEGCL